MKQTLFITGTDTGVGKTVLTALLTQFLRDSGVNAAALKPICSGGRDDARALHAAMNGALTLDEINPWHFRTAVAPVLAARLEKKTVKLAEVVAHIRSAKKRFDIVLVEGAGGVLSPLGVCSGGLRPSPSSALTERRCKRPFNSRNLIGVLRAKPIIVASNKLGVVNHILLTLEALPKNLRLETRVVLMSPPKPDASTKSNAALLAKFIGMDKIFPLPWFGNRFSMLPALKIAAVRRTLQQLTG